MGYRVPIKAHGKLTKEQIQYMWVSEAGACEKCQALDGKIYNTADEIPDKPHPNCKCWIDLIENQDAITDPIEQIRAEKREEESVKLELLKLEGDIKCLEDGCKIAIQEIEQTQNSINKFKEVADKDLLNDDEYEKILDTESKLIEIKIEYNEILKKYIPSALRSIIGLFNGEIIIPILELIKNKKQIEDDVVTISNKKNALYAATAHCLLWNLPEALALFKIGLSKGVYQDEYIKKNGTFYNSINELGNRDLQESIHSWIESESGPNNSRVLVFKSESSISKKIVKSKALKEFLMTYAEILLKNRILTDMPLNFTSDDSDLYASFHGTKITNIHLDTEGNLYAQIEDYYNFNPGRTSVKGRIGYKLQQQGDIEPYFIICPIFIPKERLLKYLPH